ncbi:UDP-N-acetylmuramoyl-L-alanine--D-glutamate ligase [Parvibaculum sp.]|jgi:UDP-N-acetylmuramoylalanine--D-glutamate ligase|uniref:UDP-N-acetylmuramoyl-L-alanine--D-glutamate ligase n=1 Tax=Parvibaculum sp. TaxID=2024848 RepID=UPI001B2B6B1C|nr:UDP-N-acetylmuramoyl-L-alanine--D-glutamate ligase [Parvibaculum sp.]MBO6633279.1 UDP-N-acetylmuramoyl-L-alanine--D-glutamate ligase [Parvibaculum sp.]MBO6679740.1 UDP-N-acetylmuramoyl-L-alanine--D-glutamate ligase [Parvibaculum sp.]MBO6683599.1 UDP-N-acetylmuramoyl-L-alanine--D-glutamate ligase [Parvibaculum sp.]
MIAATGFERKNVAVLGLGKSGLATARSLEAGGAHVFAWDDAEARRAEAAKEGFTLADSSGWDWNTFAALVLSPGIPLTHPEPHPAVRKAQGAGVEVIGDIELFQRAVSASGKDVKIVAVTGTNGKSTTTALIGHMVRRCGGDAQVGGNIGRAVLDLEAPSAGTVYVVEVSSYQIDLAPSLAPNVGVLLNITPDHIDRHGTVEHYAEVKARIFAHQTEKDTAVIGIDDPRTGEICTSESAKRVEKVVPVSVGKTLSRGVYALGGVIYDSMGTQTMKAGDLGEIKTLAGTHNWQNAAAAYAAGRALGYPRERIIAAFESFPGLAHRMEIVGEADGVRFVNDSKATNADAASKALATYDNIYWIIGGKAKEGGIASLEPWFPRVRRAYLIGDAAKQFANTLKDKVEAIHCGTLDRAVEAASRDAAADEAELKVVLLSPACASFDQFSSFEERGDVFRAAVQDRLKVKGGAAA